MSSPAAITPCPNVAVILVNWNSFVLTNDCILSLKQCTYPRFKIIVVDNGSADGSGKKLTAAHPDVDVLLSTENLGFTGGNNIGFNYSLEHGFDCTLLLNNDTFVAPDFLQHLVEYLYADPQTGAVQPRIYFNHNRTLIWNGGSYYNGWTGFAHTTGENRKDSDQTHSLKKVDWITGCAFLVKNTVLLQTGLFPLNMFMYNEDVDLSFRIREKGYNLMYIPQSIVYHIAGMSNRSKVKGKEGFVNPDVHYFNQRNRIWILKKYTRWYQAPTVIVSNFFYILIVLCYFAVRGRFSKLKAMKNAVKDGLRGSILYA